MVLAIRGGGGRAVLWNRARFTRSAGQAQPILSDLRQKCFALKTEMD